MNILFAALFAFAMFSTSAVATELAVAAPPPSHPAAGGGLDMMNMHGVPDAQLTQKGKVVSFINASRYTYIEVAQDKGTMWIAAPAVVVEKGDEIRFTDGMVMTNYTSPTLKRTFPSVLFVSKVVVFNKK